ncbi:hypothetical protein FACS1894166_11960 [Bacilli bacterium]|nr:hypothetical protein FACS1894166_11960 [Bacilli bacterium]
MKKINKLLITTAAALGIGAIVIPVVGACSGSVTLKLSTTGFDISKAIKPISYTGDDIGLYQTAEQGLKS